MCSIRSSPAVSVLLSLVVLVVLSASSAAQGGQGQGDGGNSPAAHRCRDGGWQNLARTETSTVPFTSQGECVSYAARGGTLVDRVAPTMRFRISGGITAFDGVITGTGFPSGSVVTGVGFETSETGREGIAVGPIVVGEDGAFVIDELLFCHREEEDEFVVGNLRVDVLYIDPDTGDVDIFSEEFPGYCLNQ